MSDGMTRETGQPRDEGFTLVEMIVVVIILGVLAGIALTAFLGQQGKGWDAQAKSDLRNGLTYQESWYEEHHAYGDADDLLTAGWERSPHVSNLTVLVDGSSYTLAARSGSGTVWCLGRGGVRKGDGQGPDGGAATGGITSAMCS